MINFDQFSQIELKVGTIMGAEEVEGSEKLLKLMVDLGEDEPRQILAGLKKWYKVARLVGKQFVFVANLEPRIMMSLKSNGMLLAAGDEKPIPLKPISKVPAGTAIH